MKEEKQMNQAEVNNTCCKIKILPVIIAIIILILILKCIKKYAQTCKCDKT